MPIATLRSQAGGLTLVRLGIILGILTFLLAWGILLGIRHLRRRREARRAQKAQAWMEATRAEQSQLCQARSELLSGMTRELRPPMNAILLYAELIQDHARETADPALLSDSANIQAAAQHLMALLGHLQDLARLETGGLDLASEPVSLEALCVDVERTLEPLASLRGNTVRVDTPPHLHAIPTDRARLQQILVNLLAQASQGTENEFITLRVHQDASITRFRLFGGSLGLSDPQLQQLLAQSEGEGSLVAGPSPFHHALSLALSGRLARLMGGRLLQPCDGGLLLLELPNTRDRQAMRERAATTA